MNLRDFKYLLAIKEHKNYSKAAKASFVSQPAMSMQIKKLEEELGVKLIERETKPILLTEVGSRIALKAKSLLNEADFIKEIAKTYQDPYAGQIASYPLAFGSRDPRQQTIVVLWCPWQSAMVAHNEKDDFLEIKTTKGTAAWLRFVNWTVFQDAIIRGVI